MDLLSGFCGFGEAVRESAVEAPHRTRIVPAIVKEERVHFHVALADQFAAKDVDPIDSIGLVVGATIGDVEPGVVVQERAVGTWALALDVVKEGAAHLSGRGNAHHRGIGCALPGTQRQNAGQRPSHMISLDVAGGERMLEAKEHAVVDHRRAADRARDMSAGIGEVEHPHLGHSGVSQSMQSELLAKITGSPPHQEAPLQRSGET
jgi:hypothetical protein